MVVSYGWSTASWTCSRWGWPTNVIPSDPRGWDHNSAGCPGTPELVFHNRYGWSSAGSTKGIGSMAPPEAASHTRGDVEVSVNHGVVGVRAASTATDRQLDPVSPRCPARAAV